MKTWFHFVEGAIIFMERESICLKVITEPRWLTPHIRNWAVSRPSGMRYMGMMGGQKKIDDCRSRINAPKTLLIRMDHY